MEMIAALASITGAASVFAAFAYVIRARALRPNESRIRAIDARPRVSVERGADGRSLLKRSSSSIPALSTWLNRRGYTQRWASELERAGLTLRPGEYFLARLFLAFVVI